MSGSFRMNVSCCRFSNCVSTLAGGGLSVETSSSYITRSYFLLCDCYQWASGLHQYSKSANWLEMGSFVSCSVKSSNYECSSSFLQRFATSDTRFVNGSHLSAISRECAYHHGEGPKSYTLYVTLSSCSSPYIFSFHSNVSPVQMQENICTSNSTIATSTIVLFNGNHIAKNLVLCESAPLITRYSGYAGSIVLQDCFFGSPSVSAAWFATEECQFDCDRGILNEHFMDKSACFQKGTFPFTVSNIEVKMVSMAVHPISLLVITK